MVGLTMDPEKRDKVLKLIKEKERIEAEINQQGAVLKNVNNDLYIYISQIFIFFLVNYS